MKVRELIPILMEKDPEAEVYRDDDGGQAPVHGVIAGPFILDENTGVGNLYNDVPANRVVLF